MHPKNFAYILEICPNTNIMLLEIFCCVNVLCTQVYEETGFDIRALIQGEHYLECPSRDSERPSRMYIVPGVPESTEFKPRVRKEIRVCNIM